MVDGLPALLERLTYRPGWTFTLDDRGGQPTLVIRGVCPDAYRPGRTIATRGCFPIDATLRDELALRSWVFERLLEMEHHEAGEFFVVDGERPYAPAHDGRIGAGQQSFGFLAVGPARSGRVRH